MGNRAGMQHSTYGRYLCTHLPPGASVFEICILDYEVCSGCLFSLCCHPVSLLRQIKGTYLILEVFFTQLISEVCFPSVVIYFCVRRATQHM